MTCTTNWEIKNGKWSVISQGYFVCFLCKHFMGPVCQMIRSFWVNFPLDGLMAISAGVHNMKLMTVTFLHNHERINTFPD